MGRAERKKKGGMSESGGFSRMDSLLSKTVLANMPPHLRDVLQAQSKAFLLQTDEEQTPSAGGARQAPVLAGGHFSGLASKISFLVAGGLREGRAQITNRRAGSSSLPSCLLALV